MLRFHSSIRFVLHANMSAMLIEVVMVVADLTVEMLSVSER